MALSLKTGRVCPWDLCGRLNTNPHGSLLIVWSFIRKKSQSLHLCPKVLIQSSIDFKCLVVERGWLLEKCPIYGMCIPKSFWQQSKVKNSTTTADELCFDEEKCRVFCEFISLTRYLKQGWIALIWEIPARDRVPKILKSHKRDWTPG